MCEAINHGLAHLCQGTITQLQNQIPAFCTSVTSVGGPYGPGLAQVCQVFGAVIIGACNWIPNGIPCDIVQNVIDTFTTQGLDIVLEVDHSWLSSKTITTTVHPTGALPNLTADLAFPDGSYGSGIISSITTKPKTPKAYEDYQVVVDTECSPDGQSGVLFDISGSDGYMHTSAATIPIGGSTATVNVPGARVGTRDQIVASLQPGSSKKQLLVMIGGASAAPAMGELVHLNGDFSNTMTRAQTTSFRTTSVSTYKNPNTGELNITADSGNREIDFLIETGGAAICLYVENPLANGQMLWLDAGGTIRTATDRMGRSVLVAHAPMASNDRPGDTFTLDVDAILP
jgi:hypothetical protein